MYDVESVRQGAKLIREGMAKLNNGPLDYYLTELTDCYQLLIDRFSPYKVGQRVMLKETPEISLEKSWGWMTGKHFLVKGSIAKVATISASGRGFSYGLHFEKETWIDREGKEQPVDRPGLYLFHEDAIKAVR